MSRHPHNPYYTPQSDDPLPPGWEMLIDKSSGIPFYVDHNTQRTQWSRPMYSTMTRQPPAYNHVVNPPHHQGFHHQGPHHQGPHHPGRVREIPVIRETRSDSPRRSQTPTKMEQPHQGSPSQKVYNIPVQFVDKTDGQDPVRHGSPLRNFEGRNSPRSGSPWQHDVPPAGDTGPYGWTGWVGGSPSRPQGMPHHPASQTPPFPVDTPPHTYTYPGGTTGQSVPDNTRIHYPHGRVGTPPQQSNTAEQNQPREIPIQKVPPQETHSTNGPTVQYTEEEKDPENVNLNRDAPPRATNRAAENLKAEERKATRSPSPCLAHLSPLEQVELIASEIAPLQEKVDNFNGKVKDKDYKYLEEMLTRCMLKLDRIESQGKDEVRMARKAAIKAAQSGLDHLELKAFANDSEITGEPNKEAVIEKQQETPMESEPKADEKQEANNGKPTPGHVTDMVVDSGVTC